MLHLQGFGALKPGPPRAWTPPAWWGVLGRDDRPVVHVFKSAAQRVQAEMATHDAGNEAADLLERLAAMRRRSVLSAT